jgi:hypothetical protein
MTNLLLEGLIPIVLIVLIVTPLNMAILRKAVGQKMSRVGLFYFSFISTAGFLIVFALFERFAPFPEWIAHWVRTGQFR